MARPVRIRKNFTGDRSRLTRLEEAVEKDERLGPEKKAEITELIRRLTGIFSELDGKLMRRDFREGRTT